MGFKGRVATGTGAEPAGEQHTTSTNPPQDRIIITKPQSQPHPPFEYIMWVQARRALATSAGGGHDTIKGALVGTSTTRTTSTP